MQLVAVSIIKNEADIIEAFIRHTAHWVDRHLVFDHDSTDGTREILGQLVREGISLSVFTDEALGNLQQARSNHLTKVAANEFGAEWILPLDADEFLSGPGRKELEQALAGLAAGVPASVPLLNHCPTDADDAAQFNPALRLRHCERQPAPTRKILVPRALAVDPSVIAAKGSHALQRGNESLPDAALPECFRLAHFPERSPGQQAVRIVLAELQKLSRGRAHAGVDLHYRLAFQTLAQNPETFFAATHRPVEQLVRSEFEYRGGPLRYALAVAERARLLRALLPFLEKLAASHGALLDRAGPTDPPATAAMCIRRVDPGELTAFTFAGRDDAFAGFVPVRGWAPTEGPVVDAYLPAFHWGLAPATEALVTSPGARKCRMTAEVITYSDGQKIAVELNGVLVHEHAFERVRQRERIAGELPLVAGENRLVLRYAQHLQTPRDPRKLAVIYLSLRIT
jgi:hypothetical protein